MASKAAARATFTVTLLSLSGVLLGGWAGSWAAEHATSRYDAVETFIRLMHIIEQSYVDEVSTEELVEGAIHGMTDVLDPHSSWLSPEQWRELQNSTQGSYVGIGVEIISRDDGVHILRVLPGSPAEKAGLLAQDIIVAIDDLQLADAGTDGLVEAMSGPPDTKVLLTVLRRGLAAPLEIIATRGTVHIDSVQAERIDDLGYLHVSQFQEETALEFQRALDRLQVDAPLTGLIIDVRDNAGGLLQEAVDMVDLFLDEGPITRTSGRDQSREKVFEATDGSTELPVVVLVNGGSASASELLAAALQDTGRAKLVGTRTYGKGTVQTLYEHKDGSALKLTIARYYTPSGKPIAPKNGRDPDLWVELMQDDPLTDLQAELGALQLNEDQSATFEQLLKDARSYQDLQRAPVPWKNSVLDQIPEDAQLRAAIDILRAQPR